MKHLCCWIILQTFILKYSFIYITWQNWETEQTLQLQLEASITNDVWNKLLVKYYLSIFHRCFYRSSNSCNLHLESVFSKYTYFTTNNELVNIEKTTAKKMEHRTWWQHVPNWKTTILFSLPCLNSYCYFSFVIRKVKYETLMNILVGK